MTKRREENYVWCRAYIAVTAVIGRRRDSIRRTVRRHLIDNPGIKGRKESVWDSANAKSPKYPITKS